MQPGWRGRRAASTGARPPDRDPRRYTGMQRPIAGHLIVAYSLSSYRAGRRRGGCRAMRRAGWAWVHPVRLTPPPPLTIRCRRLSRSPAAPREASLGLKLLGGLAVRVLCPEFPPRLRAGQDMDFACVSKERKKVAEWLAGAGCEPDRRFNNLNGDRQMYFNAPSGRPIDVMVDRLTMCHTLDFRPGFARQPFTIDAVDVLLSKLQIVELNEKDAHDIVHLLAGLPVGGGARRPSTPTASASCWARTGAGGGRSPATWRNCPRWSPNGPAWCRRAPPMTRSRRRKQLLELAQQAPKSMKWKLRAATGRAHALVRTARGSRSLRICLLDAGFPRVLHVAQSACWLHRMRRGRHR